jgi:hypothetical protein
VICHISSKLRGVFPHFFCRQKKSPHMQSRLSCRSSVLEVDFHMQPIWDFIFLISVTALELSLLLQKLIRDLQLGYGVCVPRPNNPQSSWYLVVVHYYQPPCHYYGVHLPPLQHRCLLRQCHSVTVSQCHSVTVSQ